MTTTMRQSCRPWTQESTRADGDQILANHRWPTRPTGDSLRFAVLAALNITDELFRCREAARDGELAERAGEIERLLDRV